MFYIGKEKIKCEDGIRSSLKEGKGKKNLCIEFFSQSWKVSFYPCQFRTAFVGIRLSNP